MRKDSSPVDPPPHHADYVSTVMKYSIENTASDILYNNNIICKETLTVIRLDL